MKKASFSLGVDIGGTFTDFALVGAAGEVRAAKVPTDYKDPGQAVLAGVRQLAADMPDLPAAIARVVHGTTLATNALLQRKGARTALLVTAGFRDTLELGRESRFDIYDINIELPAPLVGRKHVFEVEERIDHRGAVVVPLKVEQIDAVIERIRAQGIEAVAVCFLHAFRNPSHERQVAARLARTLPGVPVSISSDVMPDIREYERASTTVANAYVQPAIRGYLERLEADLRDEGVAAPLSIMTSDGGIVSCATALRHPVRLIESGPAGGAIASAFFARETGMDKAIALDMGGTTAKICVIDAHMPEQSTEFEVDRVFRFAKGSGLPLKIPVIEMIEIGAGGGSIAGMSRLGLLKVGPESAGSDPGPACYGLGGSAPTVTDADLFLGYLDPGYFLGGRMRLDRDAAARAIEERVAAPLGLSVARAAWGIHEVVNENMARAAKVHCLERGKDAREYALIGYGGAGPVHAYRVAQALGIRTLFYPLRAGVMSALGFLVAAPSFELVRADVAALESADTARINAFLREMEAEGKALVSTCGVPAGQLATAVEANLRFSGQSFELAVPVKRPLVKAELARIRQRFFALYQARYHRLSREVPVEIVSWRVTVKGPRPRVSLEGLRAARRSRKALKGHRQVFMPEAGRFVRCPIYDRYALGKGERLRGPAVIEEEESTVVVGNGAAIEADASCNLWVRRP
jgi:N-methylhydantoinase A/oxoprolinase/acetone carboxylase beta subunit